MNPNTMEEWPAGLRGEVIRLRIAITVLAIGLLASMFWIWHSSSSQPRVLSVERLDIVEPDGELAMVLSSSAHVPLPMIDGQKLAGAEARHSPALIFFDGKGDEVGGILMTNEEFEDGYRAGRHLSFDQFGQDQTLVLHHYEQDGIASTGLRIDSRPFDISLPEALRELGLEPASTREEFMEVIGQLEPQERARLFGAGTRAFFGSDFSENAVISLGDGQGRTRLRMAVTEDGDASLEFLDEDGRVSFRIPERPDAEDGLSAEEVAELNRYVGSYMIESGPVIEIRLEQGELEAIVAGQPPVPLEIAEEGMLVNQRFQLELEFEFEEDGIASELHVHERSGSVVARRVDD
jgi:hypothetical protein